MKIPAPLLCSVFIVSLVALTSSSSDDYCSPYSCNHVSGPEIKFPFRVIGRQPERCGYPNPGFNLSCNHQGETILTLPSTPGSFVVNDIDYASQIIRISDPHKCLSQRILNLSLAGSPFRAPNGTRYTILSRPFASMPKLMVFAVPSSFWLKAPAELIVAENVSIPSAVIIWEMAVITQLELRWEKLWAASAPMRVWKLNWLLRSSSSSQFFQR
ncbi:PREDICTED: RING-H2 finger protein ATL22-like [Ipomoea nil]|uniref:RING-H2 finger protein ATL22-like n=1 Tax=Ipomoea nil TaxID=35883 RepID=UPI0009014878|nr:PREDICTED: RING-H2 finger protein ATL22-like [Ipomoea nil]